MDLIWTEIRQNEDPKLARWQLFSQILSGNTDSAWFFQKQAFTTAHSVPLLGRAYIPALLHFPPY